MRVLIIEDEPLAQEELARLIAKNFPQMNIVETIDSVADSVEWLSSNNADLIFMDIHLSDGISFDIFDEVEISAPIIFTTAYNQYAIRAFDVNGIGYLLKPIDEQKLIDAVNKFQKNKVTPDELSNLISEMRQPKAYKSRMAIKLGDKISFVNMSDVAYFFAEDRVTFVVNKDGRKQIVDYNIEQLETMLDPLKFFRITRGCIASIDAIGKVSKYFNSRLKVTLIPEFDKEVLISRVKVSDFVKWLDGE